MQNKVSPRANFPILATASAVTMAAFAAQSLAHELIGHGAACLASGGRPAFVDSIVFRCAGGFWRISDLGGPAANIIFGAASLAAFARSVRFTWPAFFWWLSAAMNLLMVTGYLLQSGATGRGDWMALIDGLQPPILWRVLMAIAGCVLYAATTRSLGRGMARMVARGGLMRSAVAPLIYCAYLSSGALAIASGVLNPDGAALVWRNAFAESFIALLGLFFVPLLIVRNVRANTNDIGIAQPLEFSPAWLIFGATAAVLFVLVMGPGIHF